MRLDIPGYEKAISKLIVTVVHGLMKEDPIIGQIRSAETIHRGPTRNVRGKAPLDQPACEISSEAKLPFGTIRNSDIDAFTNFLFDLAYSSLSGMRSMFYSYLDQIADTTGNVVNAQEGQSYFDSMLELFEKIHLNFDEDGKPILPQIVVGPDLFGKIKDLELTSEQNERLEQVINEKKVSFDAQKRIRRLS